VTTSLASGLVWNAALGEFINEDHSRMQQMLQDYAPGRYQLVYVPANKRETAFDEARPYAILERQRAGGFEPIRHLSERDMQDPAGVLAWLFNGDLARHRPEDVFKRIELEEKLRTDLIQRRHADQAAERMDYAAFLAKGGRDKKHTVQLRSGGKFQVA
jgi:hypothetical protein